MKKTIFFIVLAVLCLFFKLPAQELSTRSSYSVSGKITDEQGQALQGATIQQPGGKAIAISGKEGRFRLFTDSKTGTLVISFIGYGKLRVPFDAGSGEPVLIRLKPDLNPINEIQVVGYGQTSKRLNTGSVATVSGKTIETQPVTNVLSALSGRIPGAFIQTTNGLPGGNINIQIRGKSSIAAGSNPLFIIDGVPFESSLISNGDPVTAGNISGPISPLNSINPQDIESITVLKDADATAIYGSRGTNGVILVTTKKGRSGRTTANINVAHGVSEATNLPRLLDLADYLQIRKEAFANSNRTPTAANAPDLLVWDNSNPVNWPKYLFGHTARVTNGEATISGGSGGTTFNIGGNYHQESTILPGQSNYDRGGIQTSLNHLSDNGKFSIALKTIITTDQNRSSNPQYASSGILLPPNFPALTATGEYFWRASNPVAEINGSTNANTSNILTNLTLGYQLTNDLRFKVSAGYNRITIKQSQLFPTSALPPGNDNYSQFGQNGNQSYIVEPQFDYTKTFGQQRLTLLLGGTYQEKSTESQFILARDFTNEGLMEDLGSAGNIGNRTNSFIQYKYVSVFGRANYAWRDRYVLNATIRRDGSSRFGPGNQYGTFGAVGAAWIFADESWFKKALPFISYGKLRGSYGIVGNDQITDYQYLSTYTSAYSVYQGISTLAPSRITNSDFHWETTKKLDYAIELGLFNNRILLNADRYVNRTEDQLVQYSIPRITGFASYQANLPAVIENSGWEFEVNTKNVDGRDWKWNSSFNLTIPKNKLKSFENFESSSYAQTLQVGYDITRLYGYRFLGVNPATGTASYTMRDSEPYFYNTIGKQTPDYYGGLDNTVSYGNFSLGLFMQFVKQMGVGGLRGPGAAANNYPVILSRWQKPGDITNVPKPTTAIDSYYAGSTANYFNTSYLRMKNVSFSWSLPERCAKEIHVTRCRLYAEGQNLLSWWNRNSPVLDPESGALTSILNNIPPLKTYVIGIQVTL